MNNFIKKARPAEKPLVQTNQEQTADTPKGLAKVEGILTSAIQIKWPKESNPYYLGFFQFEGLDQDIPVIFKLDSREYWAENKPNIPPRAKVLLEGKWAESKDSNRSSFTCLAWQVIANPPPITIKDLREQISLLLTTSLDKKKEWSERTDYLFKKQKDLSEMEKLSKLGKPYLQAYLLLRKAHYANYQDNLFHVSPNLTNQDQYLTILSQEIEEIAQHVRAYQAKAI